MLCKDHANSALDAQMMTLSKVHEAQSFLYLSVYTLHQKTGQQQGSASTDFTLRSVKADL